jgi:hypothetical protein
MMWRTDSMMWKLPLIALLATACLGTPNESERAQAAAVPAIYGGDFYGGPAQPTYLDTDYGLGTPGQYFVAARVRRHDNTDCSGPPARSEFDSCDGRDAHGIYRTLHEQTAGEGCSTTGITQVDVNCGSVCRQKHGWWYQGGCCNGTIVSDDGNFRAGYCLCSTIATPLYNCQ